MKFSELCLLLLTVVTLNPNGYAQASQRRVVMFVNEGFWAPEYYEPREIFDRAGVRVVVAGEKPGVIHPDPRNVEFAPVKADIAYDQVDLSKFDAITFAGGNGAWTAYFPNPSVHKLVADALRSGMITALLCSSTGLLGVAYNFDGTSAPIAQGRHVTGYFRVEGLLKNMGRVSYDPGEKDKPYVVVDKNLVTGRDPSSAKLFGETVLMLLQREKSK